MQYRMKTHQLSNQEIREFLLKEQTGTFSTVNPDGTPYSVPVHYVFLQDAVYIHGLPVGQKMSNLNTNPSICFNVYEMQGLLLDTNENPCDTNTAYISVIIQGTAQIVNDTEEKQTALSTIIQKYTPNLADKEIPQNMLNGTAVIKISIDNLTGKYYR